MNTDAMISKIDELVKRRSLSSVGFLADLREVILAGACQHDWIEVFMGPESSQWKCIKCGATSFAEPPETGSK